MAQISKRGACAQSTEREMIKRVIRHLCLGDLSQSNKKKLSEIKPPLMITNKHVSKYFCRAIVKLMNTVQMDVYLKAMVMELNPTTKAKITWPYLGL